MTGGPRACAGGQLVLWITAFAALGIASKFVAGPGEVPGEAWIRGHLGGVCYVAFWTLAALLAWPGLRPHRAAVSVFAVTCGIEFAQLWHPPALEAVRATWLGHALLGSTFSWWDFPHYAVGGLLAVVAAGRQRGDQASRAGS